MMKSFEEFQSFGKDGFEAYVASSTAVTKGVQAMAQETAEFSRKSFEKGTAAFEKLTSFSYAVSWAVVLPRDCA